MSDPKILQMIQHQQKIEIMFGTLNGLIHYFLTYQQIFQVKLLAQKIYTKIILRYTDATPLNYNSFLHDRIRNNTLNSTVIQQENLNGIRNLTQQDIQTSSHLTSEEVVTTVVTTAKQSISPIHPNLTTPRPKNPILSQVLLQSTVKPTIEPRYPHVSYQPFRPMMKPIQKQRTFT